jgi:hypothetical protein
MGINLKIGGSIMKFMEVTIKDNDGIDVKQPSTLNHPYVIEIICGDNFTREQIWGWASPKIWLGFGTDEDRVMNLYILRTVSRDEIDVIRDRILELWDEGESEPDLEYVVSDTDNNEDDLDNVEGLDDLIGLDDEDDRPFQ